MGRPSGRPLFLQLFLLAPSAALAIAQGERERAIPSTCGYGPCSRGCGKSLRGLCSEVLRLCHSMCGKAPLFRQSLQRFCGWAAAPGPIITGLFDDRAEDGGIAACKLVTAAGEAKLRRKSTGKARKASFDTASYARAYTLH